MSGNQIESEKPIKSELHSLYLLQQSQSITISQMIYMLIVYSIPMSTMSSRWSAADTIVTYPMIMLTTTSLSGMSHDHYITTV